MSAKAITTSRPRGVVLIVEDDPNDLELMQLAFKKASAPCQLIAVSDGQEAINYLSRAGKYADQSKFPKPVLILLDLNLPRVNGFEVLRWMQQHSASELPLVITLSYSQLESDVRRAYELGTSAFVAKPVDLDGSISLVRLLINLERISALRQRRSRA